MTGEFRGKVVDRPARVPNVTFERPHQSALVSHYYAYMAWTAVVTCPAAKRQSQPQDCHQTDWPHDREALSENDQFYLWCHMPSPFSRFLSGAAPPMTHCEKGTGRTVVL